MRYTPDLRVMPLLPEFLHRFSRSEEIILRCQQQDTVWRQQRFLGEQIELADVEIMLLQLLFQEVAEDEFTQAAVHTDDWSGGDGAGEQGLVTRQQSG